MIKIAENIKLAIERPESDLLALAQKRLGAPVKYFKIIKKSLDARDKRNIFWLYTFAYSSSPEEEERADLKKINGNPKVAVIGSGPAGLFCAVRLVQHGFKPVIIERGERVEERRETCLKFFNGRTLETESNVQFGEGGAGAFSDGKLNTRTKDGLNRDVLKLFHAFGADEDVLYLNKPHVGSDRLYSVLQNARKFVSDNGGEYLFNTKLTGVKSDKNTLRSLILADVRTKNEWEMPVDAAVLAIGHSARDTFEMLSESGVLMEAKDFAVGVRIEHLAAAIGRAQYGEKYKLLPTADYQLVSHAHERTVFTFCMCPGGVVIPAASEEGGVVVNGMSLRARDGVNSNSAVMVQMRREDFGSDDLFAGVRFQREIERKAFALGGGNYCAPVQLFGDFAADRLSSSFCDVQPTYAAGTRFALLGEVLPSVAVEALKAAIPDMGRRLKGFDDPNAVLSGVETRFSSPVKILRDEEGQSVSMKNLYPCGEGSGYSGGITSSAADGLKAAERLFGRFSHE